MIALGIGAAVVLIGAASSGEGPKDLTPKSPPGPDREPDPWEGYDEDGEPQAPPADEPSDPALYYIGKSCSFLTMAEQRRLGLACVKNLKRNRWELRRLADVERDGKCKRDSIGQWRCDSDTPKKMYPKEPS